MMILREINNSLSNNATALYLHRNRKDYLTVINNYDFF